MSLATAEKPKTEIVNPEPANPTTLVSKLVQGFLSKGTLHLPPDYSPENALKSAWLTLQTVQDRNGKPALQVCTKESVINALLDMVVQGLNPMKKQCYFIVYGNGLTMQRSYFGEQALAERIRPGIEVYSSVVYEGDEFEYEAVRGRTVVVRHRQKLENQRLDKIVAAYAGVVDTRTGEDLGAEIMTMAQIQKSWGQSKTYRPGGNTPHTNFPDQMALRTVIRRRCKAIINTSTDSLLLESIRRQEDDALDAEMRDELAANANGETLALPSAPIDLGQPVDAAPEPKGKAGAEPKEPVRVVDPEPQPTLASEDEAPY